MQCSLISETQLEVSCGNSKLTFELTHGDFIPYHFAFNIPENQHRDALKWLQKRVKMFEYENDPIIPFDNWNAHSMYFADADGNVVEFIARHTLDNATTEDFHPKLITEISEIGAPCENVPDLRENLKSLTGLSEYENFSDSFTAMGNARGLIILVPNDRNWLPTDIPSKPAPFQLEFHNDTASNEQQVIRFDNHRFVKAN
jgi:catechol-2,3-dioxygenase